MKKRQNLPIEAKTLNQSFSNVGKNLAERFDDSLSYSPNIICNDKTFFPENLKEIEKITKS